jgi:stress response protein YsnF
MLKIGGERRRAPLVTTADLVSKGKQRMLERDEAYVVPLAAERLVVGKREIVTGTVRVRTTVETREEPVDLMLAREAVEVERREVGRFVDEPPPVREEGDLVIIPVAGRRFLSLRDGSA